MESVDARYINSTYVLQITIPEVGNSRKIICIDECGTFVVKQTPNGIPVTNGPVGSFLNKDVSVFLKYDKMTMTYPITCANASRTGRCDLSAQLGQCSLIELTVPRPSE